MRKDCLLKYLLFVSLLKVLQPSLTYCAESTISALKTQPSFKTNHFGFGILDHDRVMQESTAAQQARQEIDQQRTDFQNEITKHEQHLRDCETELVNSQGQCNEPEFTAKRREFESKFSDIQKKVAERRHQLEESFKIAHETVVAEILVISSEIAKEQSLELILPRSMIFFARDNHDITEEVLKRLNKVLPKVSLNKMPQQINS